jgi:NAD(P)-dependent dehydrogenase (short-subunit alcohol dehydrogenase family)
MRRSAIVTGASSGIGRAVAADLVEAGFDVTASARRDPEIAGATTVRADMADPAAPAALVAAHLDRCGGLDLLVANAGVLVHEPLGEATVDAWDLQHAVNARAPFLLARAALATLRESSGLAVIVASLAGIEGMPSAPAYAASKWAAVGIAQAIRAEKVRATALCPGYVDTPMIDVDLPSAELIQPADMARAVRFLLELSPACVVPEIVVGRAGAL